MALTLWVTNGRRRDVHAGAACSPALRASMAPVGKSNIERPTLNFECDWLTANGQQPKAFPHVTANPDFTAER